MKNKLNQPNGLVTMAQLLQHTHVHERTIWKWVSEGKIPKPVVGRHVSGRGQTGYWHRDVLALVRRPVQNWQELEAEAKRRLK